jgi:hypothetical protein
MEIRTPVNACPNCGRRNDAVTGAGHNRKPTEGDLSVCLQCGHLMIFQSDLTLRPLTDEEMVRWAGNKDLVKLQKARGEVLDLKPKKGN